MNLVEAQPVFSAELRACQRDASRDDVAAQIDEVAIERYTYDDSCDAAYIVLQSPRSLNVVETNVIGDRYGQTIEVDHPYCVNVDIDNLGCLKGIELLRGGPVARKLSAILSS